MLTSRKLTGNPEAVSSYHTKEENYYFEQSGGVESVLDQGGAGQSYVKIQGDLSIALGFTRGQSITQEQFTNILAGKDAKGNQVTRHHKVIGIDLTFSAPKSVSVAGLLTVRDPRIVAAHDQAVLETLKELEYESAGTQPRAGEHVKTRNMAYVTVRDGFNRDHDPHLHTHVVVANMTSYKDKILALDGREIMTRDFNKMWGAVYRTKLAAKLKEHGYAISYTKKGEWRMDAISREVEMVFSGRRAAIEALKELGVRDMDAWRKTRKEKDPSVVKKDVMASWRAKLALVVDKTPEQNRQDTVIERDRWFADAKWSVEAKQELSGERESGEIGRWQIAARRATENSACVTDMAIITEYLTELGRTEKWEGFTYTQAEVGFQAQVRAGHILATDDGYYTTWELTRADRECVSPRGSVGTLTLPATAAKREVSKYQEGQAKSGRRTLSPLQAIAAEGILSAGSGTVVVQGDAGAGKTTMLKSVQRVATEAGWEVVGVAVQGVAARKLEEESGIKSTTLASYLAQVKAEARSAQREATTRQPRLIVFDEAGMAGSRHLAELQRSAALHNDKVVLVGDRNQIQSVGAGKPFERLVEAAAASGQLLSLSENYRQRDPALRAAVDLARKGQMRESLDKLDKMGRLMQIQDAVTRREAIAKLYNKQTLIVTGTKESRDDLNKRIRGVLLAKGALDRKTEREYELSWMDADGVPHKAVRGIAVGERIVFLQNEYKEYDLRNGECGTVTKLGEKAINVRLEDGREVQIDLRRYNAIDHGYALTTYKSQGQTFDKVVIEADTSVPILQDQRNCYVQITRARDEVRIFTDDEETLKEVAGVLSVKRDTLHLTADGVEAHRMEQRLKDLARNEALAKGIAGQKVGIHEAAKNSAASFNDVAGGPVHIDNEIKGIRERSRGRDR